MNIEKTLAAARKEWERQMEKVKAANRLFSADFCGYLAKADTEWDHCLQIDALHDAAFQATGLWPECKDAPSTACYPIMPQEQWIRFHHDHYQQVVNAIFCLSRNLNPARLKVVKRLLDRAEKLSNRFRAHSETIEMTDQLVDALALLGIEAIA